MDHAPQPHGVLDRNRPIEPQLVAQGDKLLRRRLFTQNRVFDAAGNQPQN